MKLKSKLYLVLGFVAVGLGALGAALPLLPAFPFLLLATYCFSRSSERFDTWFKNTKLYRENVEGFVSGSGLTKAAKTRIMCTVSLLMSIGFVMMSDVLIGRIVLVAVWVFHVLYFALGVKTKRA